MTEKTYTLTGKFLSHTHSDDQYTVQVTADELRRVLLQDGLEPRPPTTLTVNVQGSLLNDKATTVKYLIAALKELAQQHDIHVEWIGEVGHATLTKRVWQPRTYERRLYVRPFAGPDKRSAWRGGRRCIDVHRDRRKGQRRVWPVTMGDRRSPGLPRRGHTWKGFWRHLCTLPRMVTLHTAYCPDCGEGYTTFYDRRRASSERRSSLRRVRGERRQG